MFLIIFRQFAGCFDSPPKGESCLGVQLLHGVEEPDDGSAVGLVFVRAVLHQLFVVGEFGVTADVGFVDEAERPDDGQWHLAHLQSDRHSIEAPLKREVHQGGVQNVVAMVT